MKSIHSISIALVILISLSCASRYNLINPRSLNYVGTSEDSGVILQYKYDVLNSVRNKKYSKKEDKKGVQLVSVKVTNNSPDPVSFIDDVKIYSGEKRILPMAPKLIHSQLKQNAAIYILYGLLWFTISNCEDGECDNIAIPIGLPIGIGNIAYAASANKRFLQELEAYNLLNKTIAPGETVYGLVGVESTGFDPLTFEVE